MKFEIAPKSSWTRLPYNEAVEYCSRFGYRLPTEKEFSELSTTGLLEYDYCYWTSEPAERGYRHFYVHYNKEHGGTSIYDTTAKFWVLPVRTK